MHRLNIMEGNFVIMVVELTYVLILKQIMKIIKF